VVSDQVEINIVVRGENSTEAQITCDGQVNFELVSGDQVRITRKDHDLRLIHPRKHDHFDIMRKKLRWAEQP
jgi:NAD+ kinase